MPLKPPTAPAAAPLARDAACLALFTLAALLVYGRPVFGDAVLYFRDVQVFFAPMKQFLGESLRAGHLPLWNPFVLMGSSFIADPQAEVLYPFSLIFLFADAPRGLAISLALHLVIAQAGLYTLARSYGFARLPAAAGAVVYGLGGWMLSCGSLPAFAHSAAWAPWTILACERLWQGPRPGRIAACAAALALQMYAGWPEMFLFLAIVLGIRRLATPGLRDHRWLLAQAAALAIAAGLFAPQFLATWEAYQHSTRINGMGRSEFLDFSATAGQWRSLLFPPPLSRDNWNIFAAFPDGHVPLFLSLYLGGTALLLALAGLAGPRRHALSWLAVVAAGVFLALGAANPMAIPLLELANRFRFPEKYLFLVHFGAAMLASAGVAWLLQAIPTRFARIGGLLVVTALVAELAYVNQEINLLAPSSHYAVGDSAEARTMALAPGRLYAKSVTADTYDTPREVYDGFRTALTPNLGSMAHLSYLEGVPFILSRQQEALLTLLNMSPPGELLARRLAFLGTAYVLTDDPAITGNDAWRHHAGQMLPTLWRLKESAPLLGFPTRIVTAADHAIFSLSPEPDFARGDAVFVPPGSLPAMDGLFGQLRPVAMEPGHLVAEVTTPTGGLAVFRQSMDPGWRASVDGRAVTVVPTDGFFLGIPVPPGEHRITLDYRPTRWRTGLLVAALAALALAGLTVLGVRDRRS